FYLFKKRVKEEWGINERMYTNCVAFLEDLGLVTTRKDYGYSYAKKHPLIYSYYEINQKELKRIMEMADL
ncbi:hypothetical protein LJC20_06460, partial [Eubacteriales bacterium OttesenSCG-928-M02]|nr:hypothetical protein [Eubacteriales bacterium OttesenSCG-928-M02]